MLSTNLDAFTPREKVTWLENYIKSMKAEFEVFGEMPEDTAKVNYAEAELEKARAAVEEEEKAG